MVIMKALLFIILAGYTVRCDETYYVVQALDPPRKNFEVYWNVPTMQCKSKGIPFDDLYEKYGIIQNSHDSHRGDRIAILYDPGNFPALIRNETTGEMKFRNGGVPQRGELIDHLQVFKHEMERSIPNKTFSGIGIIDFESWRPILRQNFGVLTPYKDVSFDIEKKRHWWWKKQWIQEEAKHRFEASARDFMQTTLALAKKLRPKALWGYYGYPQCFNRPFNGNPERCGNEIPAENDQISWLWAESTALYPSVYSTEDMSAMQLAAFIRGRIMEASRVKGKGVPILPYWWLRYRDGGYFSQVDVDVSFKTFFNSNATGFIIWGSSKDVNTNEKCTRLKSYVTSILGPAVAKYTRYSNKLKDNENETHQMQTTEIPTQTTTHKEQTTVKPIQNSTTTSITFTTVTTTIRTEVLNTSDPEYTWIPSTNYTQNIENIVEEVKKDDEIVKHRKLIENILVDLILHQLTHYCSENCLHKKNGNRQQPTTMKAPSEALVKDKREFNVSMTTEDEVYYDELCGSTTASPLEENSKNKMYTTQATEIITIESPTTMKYKERLDETTANGYENIFDYINSAPFTKPPDNYNLTNLSTPITQLKLLDRNNVESIIHNDSYVTETSNGTVNDGEDNNPTYLSNYNNEVNKTNDTIIYESANRTPIGLVPSQENTENYYKNSSHIYDSVSEIILKNTQSFTTDGPSLFHLDNLIFKKNEGPKNTDNSSSSSNNGTNTESSNIASHSTQEPDVHLYETTTVNANDTNVGAPEKLNTKVIKWNIRYRDSEKNSSNNFNKTSDKVYTRQVVVSLV